MPSDAAYISWQTLRWLAPEMILALAATLIYITGAFSSQRRIWSYWAGLAILGAALALAQQPAEGAITGPLAVDGMARFVRWLVLVAGGMFVLLTARPASWGMAAEFVGSLLMALAGAMLVSAANELALLFVGLELVSIPAYVLLYLGRRDQASQEATTKYFYLSILSSAIMLYGFSYLYGVTGSTNLASIRQALLTQSGDPAAWRSLATLGLVLTFAGLGFKVAMVPFHFYAPDVYQGTTNANAGLLAVLPKAAGMVALARVLVLALPSLGDIGWRVALFLAIVTMTVGNVLALWQDNVRRLLAYSSIAHAGYMLIGLAVAFAANLGTGGDSASLADGLGATLLYLAVYVIAVTGTFAVLAYLGDAQREIDGVDELAGLGRTHPLMAAVTAVFMFSLAGLPPLAGFWGKFSLFWGAVQVRAVDSAVGPLQIWYVVLAVVGLVNAAIAAGYYLRIVGAMYFRSPLGVPRAQGGGGAAVAAVACAALIVIGGVVLGPTLMYQAKAAARSAQTAAAPADEVSAARLDAPRSRLQPPRQGR